MLPEAIAREATRLFDDARLADIDPERHADFVIARVLDRGTMASVRALLRLYGEPRIRDFFRGGGGIRVSRRTLVLWRTYLGLSEEQCARTSSPRIRSPFWPA